MLPTFAARQHSESAFNLQNIFVLIVQQLVLLKRQYSSVHKSLNELQEDIYDFAVVNFASPDMVGHTGKIDAAIRALEVVDNQLGRIVQLVLEKKGVVIITADHGNCEEMIGKRLTSHTLAPVPFILIDGRVPVGLSRHRPVRLRKGLLGDVAPTILKLMGIKKPKEMTGKSLMV
ncbi:MAG: alkaline phosphatase family protein, partial [Candidatus Woesearchaeota archaeon]